MNPTTPSPTTPLPTGDDWLDRFWEAFYRHRPVDATFIGMRAHDHALPDLSRDGADALEAEMRALLAAVQDRGGQPADRDGLAGAEALAHDQLLALDRRVAEGYLRLQLAEHESRHLLRNPSVHVGEAVFGMMSLLLPEDPTAERVEALRARMSTVPAFLDRARDATEGAPLSWNRRAYRECRGALAFLTEGVAHLGVDLGAAPREAAAAFDGFRAFLDEEAASADDEDVACGPALFGTYVSEGHFLEQSAEEVLAYAEEELRSARLSVEAAGERTDGALTGLSDLHPPADGYYDRYTGIWNEMRAAAVEQELLTWPDVPIRYEPRPAWSRVAAPDLYFLFYRSPAAYGAPDVHRYLVAPLESDWSDERTIEFLRSNNDSVIRLNHVVHHGGIGHHVQNWHARRSPLSTGRVAAVDGASRIAMFCGGTMAEGWACYATDLVAETGLLSPLEALAEKSGRIRMCARAVVDVSLHLGRMTLADAAAYYGRVAGMPRAAAEGEAVKNSMFPGAALMYLMGTDQIHALRRELTGGGATVGLRDFHDAFLSWGSIPVALTAAEMRRRAAEGRPLGAHDSMDPARPTAPASNPSSEIE